MTEPTFQHDATPTVPATGDSLVTLMCANRKYVGIILGGFAAIFLALGIFLAVKAFRTSTVAIQEEESLTEKSVESDRLELPKSDTELANLKQRDYNIGWVASLLAFLTLAGGAAWEILSPPPNTPPAQRSEARFLMLVVGQTLGVIAICAGLVLFFFWSSSLTKWLDTSDTRELRWVLMPVPMIVAGAGVAFLAVQPSRAEERDNPSIRRVVYGSNFGITVLLMIVALLVFNVLVTAKVSNRLDTTATGFYSISGPTQQLLDNMKQPVNAYAVLTPEARRASDIRQLLLAFQEASAGHFKVKFLSQVADLTELKALRAKYPQLDLTLSQQNVGGAVLLTVGEDEKRHAVIPDNEFTSITGFGREREEAFQGENRLFREIMSLTESDSKPIVYFTQSNGELSISPQDEVPDDRKATRLRAYLEKNYIEVRPINFPLVNPSVPSDASLVVIAEPRIPFSTEAASAIKNYCTDSKKKGRLLVLAGIVPGPNNQGVMKTGLEDVLTNLNVRLGDKFVYTLPLQQGSHPLETLAGFTSAAIYARNEIAVTIIKAAGALSMFLPREVTATETNPTYRATPLLASIGVTWLEENRIPEARLPEAIKELASNDKLQAAKVLSRRNRSLAVVVTDISNPQSPAPIAAVYGNARFVNDEYGKAASAASAPIEFDLIGVTVDWLRGRPPITASEIEAKKYSTYRFPPPSEVSSTRLEYLPLVLAIMSIVGLGAGVWVVRRK